MDQSRRTQLKWFGAALGAVAVPAWAQNVAEQASALEKKDKKAVPLPKEGSVFTLPPTVELLGGKTLHTKDWAGKVIVLEYWATWCPFCARQMPHVEALYKKEHHRGLEVLALSIDKKAADIAPFLKSKNYTFPVAWLSPALAKVLPKPAGLPVTIVIGRDGRVKMADSGELFAEDIAGIAKFL
ncbi:MAG: TlpA family protein disulfide reductase [Thiomonas arsenitoxydans]|uniref:TlpA family protein disulfide reductase n=1 Tax=Thiomonas arsenitoxydans (strain DSM 22701 / CIP 110005 / 3As) TaxID=426114 RepID=A0A8I1MWG3_THIA3|nr:MULTISPECIES: TlpA disulfide reductase family protein [Thiomonas]MBN8744404.1 TlpA family protein disulfide reductase [Thiomonas arsenitoxydans]ODU96006.1 MAG: redoxin [Thiomonas sp. SCN 64-16]